MYEGALELFKPEFFRRVILFFDMLAPLRDAFLDSFFALGPSLQVMIGYSPSAIGHTGIKGAYVGVAA